MTTLEVGRPVAADQPQPPVASGHWLPRAARSGLRPGWPVLLLFYGYPVWWALGLQGFVWPILAVPMGLALLRQRGPVRIPKGGGFALLFLAWVMFSALEVSGIRRMLAFGYRASLYVSAIVLLLYLFNLSERQLSTARIVRAITFVWMVAVLGGLAGLLLPSLSFTTLTELALPRVITDDPFIHSLVHVELSSPTILLGYELPRPKAPFNYTNEWGSNVALLTPFAIYSLRVVRRLWWRVLVCVLGSALIIPAIVSINRGLWLSITAGAVYVGLRAAGRGRVKLLGGVAIGFAFVLSAVIFTPLAHIVTDRAAHANLGGREALYQQAITVAGDSPVLGHGAPLPGKVEVVGASVGTHGQLWTVLVSQGIPGLLLFFAFFIAVFAATWKVSRWALWLHAVIVIALIQTAFYNLLPVQLHLVVVAMALCVRDVVARRARPSA